MPRRTRSAVNLTASERDLLIWALDGPGEAVPDAPHVEYDSDIDTAVADMILFISRVRMRVSSSRGEMMLTASEKDLLMVTLDISAYSAMRLLLRTSVCLDSDRKSAVLKLHRRLCGLQNKLQKEL